MTSTTAGVRPHPLGLGWTDQLDDFVEHWKKAIHAVSQRPTPDHAEFGPNEWLVDELHQQYLEDKNSVDPAWWEFFADYQPSDTPLGPSRTEDGARANRAADEHERRCKRQRQRQLADGAGGARTGDVRAQRPGTAASAPSAPAAAAPAAPARRADRPAAPTAPDDAATTPATAPVPRPAPAPAQQAAPTPAPLPRDVPQAQPQRPVTSSEVEVQRLKTAAARTAQNMESSLEVPTATSVRAIPAKLLIDNRIVVNNHLARARGGKVSFTHLIGYALVEALAEMPEMN